MNRLLLILCASAFLSVLLPTHAAGEAPPGAVLVDPPLAAPPVQVLTPGYDWSSRADHTHVPLDVANAAGEWVVSTPVSTTFVDLEIPGLLPGRDYDLLGPVGDLRTTRTGPQGNAIFWSLVYEPATWVLVDAATGESIASIRIPETPDAEDLLPDEPTAYCPCGNPWQRGAKTKPPPKATSTDPDQKALTLEQAAFSFTNLVKVAATTCFDHDIKVQAKVSGGMAGYSGTAGGDYSYSHHVCDTIVSQGKPVISRQSLTFRRDNYEDGSWKIYAVGEDKVGSTLAEDIYFGWENSATRYVNTYWKREVSETNAGGVIFGWGAKPYGVNVDVTISSNGRVETKDSIEYLPVDSATRTIRWRFISGDQDSTGIVGAAWLEA